VVRPPQDPEISEAYEEAAKARNEFSFCVRRVSDNDRVSCMALTIANFA